MVKKKEISIILSAKNKASKVIAKVQSSLGAIAAKASGLGLGLGVLGGGGALAGIKAVADELDKLAKTADKLGTTTEELSKLRYAAELTGVGANTLDTALQRMVRRVAEAAQGAGEAKNALGELGLNIEELNNMAPEEAFKEIASAMDAIPKQTDRVRLAFKIFDTEGVALVNTLKGGRDALEAYGAEAERVGAVVDESAARATEKFNDDLTRLNTNLSAAGRNLSASVIPAFSEFLQLLQFKDIGRVGVDSIVSADLENISERIVEVKDQIRSIRPASLFDTFFGTTNAANLDQITNLTRKLKLLELERNQLLNNKVVRNKQKVIENDQRQHNAALFAKQKEQTAALAAQLKEREKLMKSHVSSLKSFHDEQQTISEQITDLLNQTIGGEHGDFTEKVDRFDILGKINEAYTDLGTGDMDAAIEKAREGLELLAQYKEQTGATRADLLTLATGFNEIYKAAASAKGEKLKENADKGKKAYEGLKESLEKDPIKPKVEPEEGAGKKLRDQVQAEISANSPVRIPVMIDIGGVSVQLPEGAIRGVQSTPADSVENEADKRGYRMI